MRSAEDNTIYRHAARSPADPAPHDEGRYVTTRLPKRGRQPLRSKSDIAADREAAGALTALWLTLDGPGLVPWGMVAGPDGSLYVAVDTSYEVRSQLAFWVWGYGLRWAWLWGRTAACNVPVDTSCTANCLVVRADESADRCAITNT